MREAINLDKKIKIDYNYMKYSVSLDKKGIVNYFLNQIKENPNFSLGDYLNEEKFKTDLERRIFGNTSPEKLIDITPYLNEISDIMKVVFQDSFNISPIKNDITIFILPFCNEKTSKELDGVNAFPIENKFLYIFIDMNNPNWRKSLRETIPHEYAHLLYTSRYEWNSILDGIVNEGLAEHFRVYVIGGNIAPWSKVFVKKKALKELKSIQNERLNLFIDENNLSLYLSYFFGTEDLPNWYGYSLGYWMIDEVIEKTNFDLLDLFKTSPKKILEIFHKI